MSMYIMYDVERTYGGMRCAVGSTDIDLGGRLSVSGCQSCSHISGKVPAHKCMGAELWCINPWPPYLELLVERQALPRRTSFYRFFVQEACMKPFSSAKKPFHPLLQFTGALFLPPSKQNLRSSLRKGKCYVSPPIFFKFFLW